MFGYVTVCEPELKVKDLKKYRAYYCGLCRTLKEDYGFMGQMTLTYDMTFAVILLSSLYETITKHEEHRCKVHPVKRQHMLRNEITSYAAAMNVLLAYYHMEDDWQDDRKVSSLMTKSLIQGKAKKIIEKYPRQPQDIAVLDAVSTPERFRADLNAREITYEYAMDLSPIYDLFHKNYRSRLTDLLSDSLFNLSPEQTAELPNILLMETAAHSLLGKHDFKHFSSIRKKKGTEKEIKAITFFTEKATLYIRMTANDFLYQMAPFILGTLLDIGIGKRPVECINAILEGKEKPSASCDTKGLILYDIVY